MRQISCFRPGTARNGGGSGKETKTPRLQALEACRITAGGGRGVSTPSPSRNPAATSRPAAGGGRPVNGHTPQIQATKCVCHRAAAAGRMNSGGGGGVTTPTPRRGASAAGRVTAAGGSMAAAGAVLIDPASSVGGGNEIMAIPPRPAAAVGRLPAGGGGTKTNLSPAPSAAAAQRLTVDGRDGSGYVTVSPLLCHRIMKDGHSIRHGDHLGDNRILSRVQSDMEARRQYRI